MAYFGGSKSRKFDLRVDGMGIFVILTFVVSVVVLAYTLSKNINRDSLAPLAGSINTSSESPSRVVYQALVSTRDIRAGERFSVDMFESKFTHITGEPTAVVSNWQEIFGKYASNAIPMNSPLSRTDVTDVPPTNELTAKIPVGFRAVTVSVDGESGVEGWVRPGAKVDVVWTTEHMGRPLISTIVENVSILSVERSTEKVSAGTSGGSGAPAAAKPNSKSHVTMLARVSDAQKIQLAKTAGTISLSLRGDVDTAPVGNNTITIDRLIKRVGAKTSVGEGKVVVDGKPFVLADGALIPESEVPKD